MEENINLYLPAKETAMEYKMKMQHLWNDSYKTVYFQYHEIYNNDETIVRIKKTIASLRKGDSLILFGFLLLSQFNVGLIYLLTHTFDCVEFNVNDEIGCSVIFKNFKSEGFILQEIEQIYKITKDIIKDNKIVLSIISMLELYGKNKKNNICNILLKK
jgi:hypothetical protein